MSIYLLHNTRSGACHWRRDPIHERDDTSVLVSLGELFYMIIGTTVLSHGLSMEKTRRTLECFIMFKPKQYLQPLILVQIRKFSAGAESM